MSQVTTCCVAGHGVQCSRSAFLGGTCDAVGLTVAISVAGPQQTIGPAMPEWQTGDPGVRDQRRRSGRPVTQDGKPALPGVADLRRVI